jgi:hypothetical protein
LLLASCHRPGPDYGKDIQFLKDEIREIKTALKAKRIAEPESDPVYKGKALRYWVAAASDKDDETRLAAARALGKLGIDNDEVIQDLIHLAERDGSVDVRVAALTSLGEADIKKGISVDFLTRTVKEQIERRGGADYQGGKNAEKLYDAAMVTLGKIGPQASTAVDTLVFMMRRTDIKGDSRTLALTALDGILQGDIRLIDAILAVLNEEEAYDYGKGRELFFPFFYPQAIRLLGKYKEQSRKAVPILLKCAKCKLGNVSWAAKEVLQILGHKTK